MMPSATSHSGTFSQRGAWRRDRSAACALRLERRQQQADQQAGERRAGGERLHDAERQRHEEGAADLGQGARRRRRRRRWRCSSRTTRRAADRPSATSRHCGSAGASTAATSAATAANTSTALRMAAAARPQGAIEQVERIEAAIEQHGGGDGGQGAQRARPRRPRRRARRMTAVHRPVRRAPVGQAADADLQGGMKAGALRRAAARAARCLPLAQRSQSSLR